MHLTVDGHLRTWGYPWGFDREHSVGYLQKWLTKMPATIEMAPIQPAIALWSGDILTGYVLIAESHISVHLAIPERRAFVDIFSCKGFDAERVLNSLERDLAMEALNIRKLPRGLEYGTDG